MCIFKTIYNAEIAEKFMTPKRILYFRLKMLLMLSIIWVFFGFLFLFNILEIEKRLLNNRSLVMFCLSFAIIGLVVSASLIFYLRNAFTRYPLWVSFLLKLALSLGLFIIVAFCILAVYFIFSHHGDIVVFANRFFEDILFTRGFLIFMLDLGLLTLISLVLLEITDKYGPGGFWSMMRGEYHKPKIENRIFIFLDINDATTIAEKIGHEKYFQLLKNFLLTSLILYLLMAVKFTSMLEMKWCCAGRSFRKIKFTPCDL